MCIRDSFYNEANNISSAVAAKDLLQNAYVFESDLLLYNPKLITKYQYLSLIHISSGRGCRP